MTKTAKRYVCAGLIISISIYNLTWEGNGLQNIITLTDILATGVYDELDIHVEGKSTASVFEPHEICSYFPSQPFTATRFWQEFLPRIKNASKNPLIPELLTDEEDAKMQNILENILTPSRMRRALLHMPTASHYIVKNVVEIVQKRIKDPENNPPLRIAVFGGSVTIGRGCYGRGMSNTNCAWPRRLEFLFNQFAKMDVVKVYNLGVGGTSSQVGTNMVKFWMYPEEISKVGPDVIINSYSTNDSFQSNPEDNEIWRKIERTRLSLQPFIRAALQSKECDVQPLVVHVDDYLGPQTKWLLGELSYSIGMTQQARWYDTVGISYGELVRDLTYKDRSDQTFFNSKDVHFGHWAHQSIAWSVGYASVELLSNYCDDEYTARTMHNHNTANTSSSTISESRNPDYSKEKTKKEMIFLPPVLTDELVLQNATNDFNAALDRSHQMYLEKNCTYTNSSNVEDRSPCIAAWISSPGGYGESNIENFMRQHSSTRQGWKTETDMGEGWANKIGYVSTEANATFTLKFDNIKKNIKSFTMYYIRSYGEKWKDSCAKVTISSTNKKNPEGLILASQELSGVHANEETRGSFTISETIELPELLKKGETMNIKVDLVSGNHFKIMGLMICNKVHY